MSGVTRTVVCMTTCLFLATASSLWAQDRPEALETLKEKESYSIGYQVGLSMVADGVEVDLQRLIQGLEEALDRTEPRLTEEEMRGLIVDLKRRSNETRMRRIQETIVRNAEESQSFLVQNGQKEGVRTTESGLQYMVLREGEGATPGPRDTVTVHYRGTFIDGTEFDSSYGRGEPASFKTDDVIKGWTEALQMMKVGSKWTVFVPPDLAYGRGGMGERIPPNKVLVFEMELVSVE